MNVVAIPKNASMAVCAALGIRHRHVRASELDAPRWAIVRNPYTRALSAYSFARAHHSRQAKECLGGAETFAEFLRLPDNMLTRSQSWWLDAPTETIRFEDLPEAFEARFGVPLPVANSTAPATRHDDETRALVMERYAEDFERFSYVA